MCKGKYKIFYDEIENLGRCVYRRYQIWISNKMFIQVNRDKFLYRVIDHETKPYVYEGKKQGYAEASDEYEKKLLTQAEEFIKQKKDFQMERDAYEALLDEYEIEIDKLNSKLNKSEDEKEYLYQLMLKERELKKLGK